MNDMPPFLIVAVAMLAVFALILFAVFALLGGPWLRAALNAAPVPLFHIVAMRLRGNPPTLLIDAYIALKRAGMSVTISDVEDVYIDSRNRVSTSGDLVELVKKGVGIKGVIAHSERMAMIEQGMHPDRPHEHSHAPATPEEVSCEGQQLDEVESVSPIIVLLPALALGGIIQAAGVVYAFVGFNDVHWPLAIGAFIFGGLVESGGVIVLVLRKR